MQSTARITYARSVLSEAVARLRPAAKGGPGAMDLKALILAKRKATAEEFQGRKYVKRSDLEAARLQKLRDEEEQERQQGKVRRACRRPTDGLEKHCLLPGKAESIGPQAACHLELRRGAHD